MDMNLRGRAVLVTGGSRGIGLEVATCFAREGANVAICARDPVQLEAAAKEIAAVGGECFVLPADLLDAKECARVVDASAERFGRLDVLINNASNNVDRTPKCFEDATDSQLLERVNGKAMATIRCSRAALPHMRKVGGGRIVIVAGLSARSVLRSGEAMGSGSGLPQGLGNSMVTNFAKFLAEEVAKDQIMVNVVHPHFTKTSRYPGRLTQHAKLHGISEPEAERDLLRQMPIGRMVMPSDIAPLVVLLGSSLSGATTGQSIAIDGGASRSIIY